MNYWLLTTEYPPFYGGGISTYCYNTSVMLTRNGHAVTVFVNDLSVKDVTIEISNTIRIVRFNPSRTNCSGSLGHVTNTSYAFAHVIREFIKKEGKPDIIEAQEYLGIAYYLLQYKYLLYDCCRDIPVIITIHAPSFLYLEYNHVPVYRYPNYWIGEMERFCLKATDHLISPSQYMSDELEKRIPFINKRITVIPNPFDNKNVLQNITTSTPPGDIVFYGKLTVQKGVLHLLRYFSQLWDNGFPRPLHLIGEQDIFYHPGNTSMGDMIRKKYSVYIKQKLLRLENRIKPSSLAERLSKAELVIIPGNNDNLPYAVFEMMSMGKIVLASKQGGQSEIIENGVDGFIFDHNKPETFSKQLLHILSLPAVEKNRIAVNAAEKIKNKYSHEVIYRQKNKILESVLRRSHKQIPGFPYIRTIARSPGHSNHPDEQTGKLSVVIPCYNMGKYIDECIDSIKKSGYADKEIIIINDGSTDKKNLIKLDLYRQSHGIKVIDTINRGLAAARNHGAQHSSGQYLAFLDADDIVLPDYYDRAITVLRHYENVHFAGCWTQYFGDSSALWPSFLPEPPLILFHNLVNSSSLIYKRQSFLDAGMNDTTMPFPGLEDYESVIAMIAQGLNGVIIPDILFKYRVRPDSMIRGINRVKKLIIFQGIAEKHRNFYANYANEIFNLLNANGPGIFLDNPSLDLDMADKFPFGRRISRIAINLVKRNRYAKTIAYKLAGLKKTHDH